MKIARAFLVIAFLMMFAATGAYAQKGLKVGYVDLSRLFDEYHKTQEYDKVLAEQNTAFETERNAKIEEVKEAQGKLSLLAEDKKAELKEEIEQMKADIMEYDQKKKQDLTKERNEKIREILLEIEKVVSDFAEKEKYSVILNDRVLIYGSESYNLTEPILKKLNAGQK